MNCSVFLGHSERKFRFLGAFNCAVEFGKSCCVDKHTVSHTKPAGVKQLNRTSFRRVIKQNCRVIWQCSLFVENLFEKHNFSTNETKINKEMQPKTGRNITKSGLQDYYEFFFVNIFAKKTEV